MIPLTFLCDEYIDRPKLTEQKNPFEYIVAPPPTSEVGTINSILLLHTSAWLSRSYHIFGLAQLNISDLRKFKILCMSMFIRSKNISNLRLKTNEL